jgi:hypothetical protein
MDEGERREVALKDEENEMVVQWMGHVEGLGFSCMGEFAPISS